MEEVKQKQGSAKSQKEDQEEEKDRHPEKRMKAAFSKFEEEKLLEYKKDYPTLKQSQLKEKIWKEVRILNCGNIMNIVEEITIESYELARVIIVIAQMNIINQEFDLL